MIICATIERWVSTDTLIALLSRKKGELTLKTKICRSTAILCFLAVFWLAFSGFTTVCHAVQGQLPVQAAARTTTSSMASSSDSAAADETDQTSWAFWKQRVIGFGMLLMIALIIIGGGSALSSNYPDATHDVDEAWDDDSDSSEL